MSLLTILLVLVIAGVALWLVNTFIPMDKKDQKHSQHCCCNSYCDLAVTGIWAHRFHQGHAI